jgi:glutathione-specific gamma-glutamylcyclotransferase
MAANEEGNFQMEAETWIFGYGSLVWKADFPYVEKLPGYVTGFERKFYQNSIDHRGTRQKPGRVVTLITSDNAESKVFGMGYRISSTDRDAVLQHLDHREKNGYDRHHVKFYPDGDGVSVASKDILLYVATHDNPSFAGHTDSLEAIADQMYTAVGESGHNREYVYKLADAMRQLYPKVIDEHLFGIEQILKRREAEETGKGRASASVSVDRTSLCQDG